MESPPPLATLRREGPIALFLDFDGTLVDMAGTPDGIAVPLGLAQDLAGLADRLGGPLALVSGRAIVDLERHLGPLAIACAGSHGIDRRHADGRPLGAEPERVPRRAEEELRAFADANGVLFEMKPHGGALHFRSNPHVEEEGVQFASGIASAHDLVLKRGKFVVEMVRPGADKGGAVRAFMQHPPFAGCRPIFIGDDITDEDGIRAAEELGGFGILVGDRRPTAARYCLPDPRAVHAWLNA